MALIDLIRASHGFDQHAWMHNLISAFSRRMYPITNFTMRWLKVWKSNLFSYLLLCVFIRVCVRVCVFYHIFLIYVVFELLRLFRKNLNPSCENVSPLTDTYIQRAMATMES